MNPRIAWFLMAVVLIAAGGIFVIRSLSRPTSPQIAITTLLNSEPPAISTTTTSSAPVTTVADPEPGKATAVVNVSAVDENGAAAAGYTVQSGSEVFGCIASSASTGIDIVGCSPTASSADVCWVAPDRTTLLCGESPWKKSLSRMTSSDRIGAISASVSPSPWGLELANGTKCQLRNGGSWPGRADGYAGAYHCDRPSTYILVKKGQGGAVDQSGNTWTVLVGDLSADNADFPPPVKVQVATAYFATRI